MSQHKPLADVFTDNFNYPERQWDCFASVARMQAWCEAQLAKIKPSNEIEQQAAAQPLSSVA